MGDQLDERNTTLTDAEIHTRTAGQSLPTDDADQDDRDSDADDTDADADDSDSDADDPS